MNASTLILAYFSLIEVFSDLKWQLQTIEFAGSCVQCRAGTQEINGTPCDCVLMPFVEIRRMQLSMQTGDRTRIFRSMCHKRRGMRTRGTYFAHC